MLNKILNKPPLIFDTKLSENFHNSYFSKHFCTAKWSGAFNYMRILALSCIFLIFKSAVIWKVDLISDFKVSYLKMSELILYFNIIIKNDYLGLTSDLPE